jgi:hypothetical protein
LFFEIVDSIGHDGDGDDEVSVVWNGYDDDDACNVLLCRGCHVCGPINAMQQSINVNVERYKHHHHHTHSILLTLHHHHHHHAR